MTTALRLALDACGLSQREAAELLGVRTDTVDKAARGKSATPAGWIRQLRELHAAQRASANETLKIISRQVAIAGPGEIELGFCADDTEARSLGFPCVGAHSAVLRMVWESLPDACAVTLVPRASTRATAAAAEAHNR